MNRRDFLKYTVSAASVAMLARVVPAGELFAINKSKMKITVLTGSPRRNGNTNHMAERFIAGARENGHTIFRFDCAARKVAGCMGCNSCGMNGECVIKDDFDIVRPHLTEADMVVFVTPMYYFGFSAQIKSVIDRFYAINGQIKGANKKAALIMAYANSNIKEAEPMKQHYLALIEYLGWKNVGTVIAPGVWTAGAVKDTGYAEESYQLGKSI